MARRKRRKFTQQCRADAVRLVRTGGKALAAVANEFDLNETAVGEWVRRAEVDAAPSATGASTTAERAELSDLRKRLARAEMERDILREATAFFARERA